MWVILKTLASGAEEQAGVGTPDRCHPYGAWVRGIYRLYYTDAAPTGLRSEETDNEGRSARLENLASCAEGLIVAENRRGCKPRLPILGDLREDRRSWETAPTYFKEAVGRRG